MIGPNNLNGHVTGPRCFQGCMIALGLATNQPVYQI